MRLIRTSTVIAVAALMVGMLIHQHSSAVHAAPPATKKHVLVIGQTKGFEHDSVPDAMGTIWKMGHTSGLWDTYIRTDTELITKGKVGPTEKPRLLRCPCIFQHDW